VADDLCDRTAIIGPFANRRAAWEWIGTFDPRSFPRDQHVPIAQLTHGVEAIN
jgi:hypothetical protein